MNILFFGIYEQILYPYLKDRLKINRGITSESDFVFDLLLCLQEKANNEEDYDVSAQAASRYKKGTRTIPKKIIALFRLPNARDEVVKFMEQKVIPYIEEANKQPLIMKLSNAIRQDATISLAFKEKWFSETDSLAFFLADILIYTVGIDPTKEKKPEITDFKEVYNLPSSNDWFTGRRKELALIKENFKNGARIQILHGMGGMGKSQLARRFVYENYRFYIPVHWVNAQTTVSIVRCYREFLMEINKGDEGKAISEDSTDDEICRNYIKYMDSNTGWLIIYDNCDYYTDSEYKEFIELLPKNPATGNILITTRNKRSIGNAKRIEVGTIPEEDAKNFLLNRTDSIDTVGAKQLAQPLGNFPLALEIAGAYIHATPGCDFPTYLGYLEQQTGILNKMVEVTDYNQTIRDILILTLNRIKEDWKDNIISLCVEDVLHIFAYGAPFMIDLRALTYLSLQGEAYDIWPLADSSSTSFPSP